MKKFKAILSIVKQYLSFDLAKKVRKNCLSCAFCTRNKETWVGNFPIPATLQTKQLSLNEDERKSLNDGDDSFIGKEIREREAWDLAVEQNRAEFSKQGNPILLNAAKVMLTKKASMFDNDAVDAELMGLPERPKAPNEDYLSCYREQWNENNNTTIAPNRIKFLKETRCPFYFPFSEKGNKTLSACEESRQQAQSKRWFLITTFLVVVSIGVTIWVGMRH